MSGQQQSVSTDRLLLAELITIRRLMVYGLMRSGASQRDIGKALGIDHKTVSRMLNASGTATAKKRAR